MNVNRGLKQEVERMFRKHGKETLVYGDIKQSETQEFFADTLREAKTIIFSKQQAEIFKELATSYTDTLDYRLPFNLIFLQFDMPVRVSLGLRGPADLSSLYLAQFSEIDGIDETLNAAHGVCWNPNFDGGWGILSFGWHGEEFPLFDDTEEADGIKVLRQLAIACIGYINCENIYLHKEGEVPDKVNRKREREGKKILDPYYVCRIRGVQYDSNGNPTGEGTHHGFRYDVRGHFRKMAIGRTTWVRPHQRGLQNEMYIPKTYVVEKGAKVMS